MSVIVLFLYVAAAIWLVASSRAALGAISTHGKRLIGLTLTGIAWLLHGYSLCALIFRTGNLALSTAAAASLVGWVIAAIAWFQVFKQQRFALISAVLLVFCGVTAATVQFGHPAYTETQDNWTLITHVALAVLAYSLIAVAAVLALALLWLDRRLHRHQAIGRLAQFPSVEALEMGMFQALTIGFMLLTLALFSGFIFVEDLFAQHLAHKTILSCIAWLLLVILLLGRWRLGWRGRRAASWTLSCFVLLGLAYFGSKLVLESILGRHWS